MVTGGRVEAPIAAAHRRSELLSVAEVPRDAFELGAVQAPQVTFRSEQRLDLMPARDEFVDEVRADKPGGAGDKASHGEGLFRLCGPDSTLIGRPIGPLGGC